MPAAIPLNFEFLKGNTKSSKEPAPPLAMIGIATLFDINLMKFVSKPTLHPSLSIFVKIISPTPISCNSFIYLSGCSSVLFFPELIKTLGVWFS